MNAKAAFLAFTCILITGISNATADELLDLETRDLAEMKTVSGITVVFDPGKISWSIRCPGPWDRHPAEAAQQRTSSDSLADRRKSAKQPTACWTA